MTIAVCVVRIGGDESITGTSGAKPEVQKREKNKRPKCLN